MFSFVLRFVCALLVFSGLNVELVSNLIVFIGRVILPHKDALFAQFLSDCIILQHLAKTFQAHLRNSGGFLSDNP
jgi:hypothetical protein